MAGIANPPGWEPVADTGAAKRSPVRRVFRIVRWTIYVCALFVLLLVLHKAPPPRVETSPPGCRPRRRKVPGGPAGCRAGTVRDTSHGRGRAELVSRLALGSFRGHGTQWRKEQNRKRCAGWGFERSASRQSGCRGPQCRRRRADALERQGRESPAHRGPRARVRRVRCPRKRYDATTGRPAGRGERVSEV